MVVKWDMDLTGAGSGPNLGWVKSMKELRRFVTRLKLGHIGIFVMDLTGACQFHLNRNLIPLAKVVRFFERPIPSRRFLPQRPWPMALSAKIIAKQ